MGIKKKHTPGCGCCNPPACSFCSSPNPTTFQLVIAGVTDGSCADCDPLVNATWTADLITPFTCTYRTGFFAMCGGSMSITVTLTADITITLSVNTIGNLIRWKKTSHDGNCQSWSSLDIPWDADLTAHCVGSGSTLALTAL